MIGLEYLSHIQNNIWILFVAFLVFIGSIVFFEFYKKKSISIILLILSAFGLYSFMALADPFVQIWDEQFHALVAKNLQNHFLKPTLLENPILEITSKNYNSLAQTEIWLHKQPLFLWQIALSFKIFGISLYSLRLPSILMFSLLIPIIYRIGSILKDPKSGYYTAIIFLSSSYLLQLVAGRLSTDHNDAAFIFYTTASFWAWFEYRKTKKIIWLPIIGILSGAAILVKWLTGLIVFAGWFMQIALTKTEIKQKKAWIHLIISGLIAFLVFLPWQFFVHSSYPEMAKIAQELNIEHLKIAVHGHVGDWLYHFNSWSLLIGNGFNWLALTTLIIIPFTKLRSDYKIATISWIILVHLFFMFVPTKMPAFTLIVAPIVLTLNLYLISSILDFIKNEKVKKYISIFTFLFIFIYLFDFEEIKGKNIYWNHYKTEADHFREIADMNLQKESHFYNFYYYGDIRFMFLTDFSARDFLPTKEQIEILKTKEIPIYIFDDGKLPEYILGDKEISKIKCFMWPENLNQSVEIYR